MHELLQNGAQALVRLQSDVRAVVDADHRRASLGAGAAGPDFEAIDALVIETLMGNVTHANPLQRQGFVRSLSWLFHTIALESVPDVDATMVADVLRTLQPTEGVHHG